ncbi:MAG: hypothetical protein HY717_13100 [Planctomycetes bacterium]|nr:hypothetical protein [Planctomycetota bacterium]
MKRSTIVSILTSRTACLGTFLLTLLLPAPLRSEDPPPSCLGGETFKFEVQGSVNGGLNWSSNYVWLQGRPYQQINVMVRTAMTVTSGQTQGWSFGLEHSPTRFHPYYGGSITLNSVTTSGTDTPAVQNGGPPDFENTSIRSGYNGYTQGVTIDTTQQTTLGPVSGFITSKACYTVTMPMASGYYSAYVKFTHNIGDPKIRTVITQGGQSHVPCARNFQFALYVSPYTTPSPGGCDFSGGPPPAPAGSEPVAAEGPAGRQALNGCAIDDTLLVLDAGPVANFPAVTEIRLWRGASEPPGAALAWTTLNYDDSEWELVSDATPIGYDASNPPSPIGHLLDDMRSADPLQGYTSFYVRITFDLALLPGFNGEIFSALEADLGVDDGFIAYLSTREGNEEKSREIRRLNIRMPFPPDTFGDQQVLDHDSLARSPNPVTQRFSGYADLRNPPNNPNEELDGRISALRGPELHNGPNVLAVQVVNIDRNDIDCIF